MKNKFAARLMAFAAALLLLLFFSNDFGLIDIQKTSIITAIGLDSNEKGTLDFTAQIAVPNPSGSGKASNVFVADAATVGDAIAELNQKTGWYPTLVHCRLILIGNRAADQDVFRFLDYFLRSQFVEDTCLVAVCADRAQAALAAQSPVNDMTFAAITKVLSSQAHKTGLVSVTNLRDFAKGYYSAATSGFLPVLSVKSEASDSNESSQGGSQSAENAQTAGNSQENSNSDVFDASQTMLFLQGKRVEQLDADQTLAFNLAETDTDFAYGNVIVSENGRPITYNLRMRISKKSKKIADEGGVPVMTFQIRARAQITDANRAGTKEEVAQTAIVPDYVLRAAEERMRAQLDSVFEKAKNSGCDLFNVCQSLQRFQPKLFAKLGTSALVAAKAVYDIRFDSFY